MNTTQEKELFRQVALKLGCRSHNESCQYVSTILHLIRDQLSEEESEELIRQFGDDLFRIYVFRKPRYSSRVLFNQIDHFATQLFVMDQAQPSPLFHTKMDAMHCSIILLYELDKRYGILKYFPYTFCHDLKSRSHEAA